jgi:hypothetical protein
VNRSGSPAYAAISFVAIWCALLASACESEGPCEEALAKRSSGAPTCNTLAQCNHVRAHPDQVVSFYFVLFKSVPGQGEAFPMSKRLHNQMCVAEFLRARGVTRHLQDSGLNDVVVAASYEQVQPAFDLAIVNWIELGCRTDDLCTHCAELSEAQCQKEPFCALRPSGVDPSRQICDIYGRLLPL